MGDFRIVPVGLDAPMMCYAFPDRSHPSKSAIAPAADATVSLAHGDREVSASQESRGHADHNGHPAAGAASPTASSGRGGQHAPDGTHEARAQGLAGRAPAAEGRLSLRQCRELLPPGFEIGDEELGRVRDALYNLAEVMLDEGGHLLPRLDC